MTTSRAAAVMAMTLLIGGCDEAQPAPCEPLEVSWSVVVDGGDNIDLLFVIDNSGSMTEEQASLAIALPRLLTTLLTGDADGDGEPEIDPVSSLQLGVVTTDMGTGGHTVPTCSPADFGDDGVLRTTARTDIAGCSAEVPSFMRFSPEDDPTQAARDFGCVAVVGNGGCGFEQPLEAMLKALSPATASAPRFEGGSSGHGDGANAGFLRPDSTLMVVILSDEEDCSTADTDLFDPESPAYAGTDLNLRCLQHPEALHPVDRYVDGLLSLRAFASDVVFVPIVGIPVELATERSGYTDWPAITGPPEVRDPRLVERVDPDMPTRMVPSCNVPGRGQAFPPIRIAETAQQLSLQGARVSLHSICQESFTGIVDSVLSQLRSPLLSDCLSTPLEREADGRVDCTMTLTLPADETCAAVGATERLDADGTPEREDGRPVCEVAQLPVDAAVRASGEPPPGEGFWVDDYVGPFTCAGPPSRVEMPAVPARTRVTLRCPVTALSDSILGDPCDPLDFAACPSGPGSPIVCDSVTQRCAESCRFDSECVTYTDAICAIEEGDETGVCRRTGC